MKKALITGITGQDGSYLAELLLEKGYEVHGIVRRSSTFNRQRIEHLYTFKDSVRYKNEFYLHYGDITDTSNIINLLTKINPDEFYNLAAQSHVRISFDIPEYTAEVDALGTLRVIESIKALRMKTKFYQASTSELYGKVIETPQNEETPFYPRSPYGVAKLYGYWIIKNYREAYNIFACNGILFNHESPRRPRNFVTRKITHSAINIKKGNQEKLFLGNLNSKRDWGYAPEYVEGMWRMLQQESPEDFVLATGEAHTVREFVETAFGELDINIEWEGEGINEIGINKRNGKEIIGIEKKFFRPTEVDILLGDASKAKKKLGWQPKVKFDELVRLMIAAELKIRK